MPAITKRQNNNNNGGYYYYGNGTNWDNWVRWLILGLIVAGALMIFVLASCITARRRRRRGLQPYRGTAWVPVAHGQPVYNSAPAPPYGETATTSPYYPTTQPPAYSNEMADLSGKRYEGGEAYAPPAGPPPGFEAAHVRK